MLFQLCGNSLGKAHVLYGCYGRVAKYFWTCSVPLNVLAPERKCRPQAHADFLLQSARYESLFPRCIVGISGEKKRVVYVQYMILLKISFWPNDKNFKNRIFYSWFSLASNFEYYQSVWILNSINLKFTLINARPRFPFLNS